ncbi:MAG: acyl-CoA dehydrogenase [Pyrinomonadaceae bacterium]|nr:acyl-CoA dehydrogenase [Pyrinomonadaceae bacterium]
MDFHWSEEQKALKDEVIAFSRDEISDESLDFERRGEFPYQLWKLCADFGIQGLASPSKFGGKFDEIDLLTSTLAMEGFGYGCADNGLAFALNAQMWTVQLPIALFGNDNQKSRFLEKMARGEMIGAHALTESETGSDAFSLATTATKVEGGYLLNGEKDLISLAIVADIALVFANSNPEVGKWGVTAFIVDLDTEGCSRGPLRKKMGLRSVPMGSFLFKDCFVPAENRIGDEGTGFSLSNQSLEFERCAILASQLGAMERQLEDSVEYVRTRQQFGKAIGKYQSVSNRIADMKLRLETARLLLYKTAWLKQRGESAMLEAALLKLHLSECFLESSIDAVRNAGGIGFLEEFGAENDLRDAVGGVLYAGTSDIQRNIIARLLGV